MWVKVDSKLKTRNGTGVDKTRLQTIFTKLGFYVVTDDNNTHSKMLEELKTVKEDVYKLKYSSLFVAILSHGDQGRFQRKTHSIYKTK